jgi:15-cis-phytoene synthase
MNRQLKMAYAVCRGVARSQAKNFYYAFLALPSEKRDALCAVYAFMRHADDLADEPGLPLEQRRSQLVAWADAIRDAAAGISTDDPVIMAVADTQQQFKIPVEQFEQLVYGTALDLQHIDVVAPYRTFDELYRYCYFVASIVGLICIRIFGYKDPAAEPLAEKTGVAFQLTNIIRDVKEDGVNGRVYLPQEDLERFGLSADELTARHLSNGFNPSLFSPLLAFEADRAREFYKAAEELLPLIDEDARPALWTLVTIYRRLLEKIAARDYDVFQEKVRLSVPEKLGVLSRGLVQVIF